MIETLPTCRRECTYGALDDDLEGRTAKAEGYAPDIERTHHMTVCNRNEQ